MISSSSRKLLLRQQRLRSLPVAAAKGSSLFPPKNTTTTTTTKRRSIVVQRCNISSSAASSSWYLDPETGIVNNKHTHDINKNNMHKKDMLFQTIIGLEIHAQLDIPTKLFSPMAANAARKKPNDAVHPLDVAVPGWYPRLSREAVAKALLTASALRCDVPPVSRFERKHYTYADLPLGYQITQQRWPIATNGTIKYDWWNTASVQNALDLKPQKKQNHKNKHKKKKNQQKDDKKQRQQNEEETERQKGTVRIERIQLEQDTGKTTNTTNNETTMVDFNRAGCALIEIVTSPDLRSSTETIQCIETLRNLLRHIGVCDGKMEDGSFRVDLNINLQPKKKKEDEGKPSSPLRGPRRTGRIEVKNLNSLKQIQHAIDYETKRQAEQYCDALFDDNSGSDSMVPVHREETRTFHVKSGRTVLIRTKDKQEDYRFLPEPDLPPIVLRNEPEHWNELFLDDTAANDNNGNTATTAASNSNTPPPAGNIDNNNNASSSSLMADGIRGFVTDHGLLPELPYDTYRRLVATQRLPEDTASLLTQHPVALRLHETAIATAERQLSATTSLLDEEEKEEPRPKTSRIKIVTTVAKIVCNELFSLMKTTDEENNHRNDGNDNDDYRITGEQLGELVAMILEGTISNTMAKKLLVVLYNNNNDDDAFLSPRLIAKQHGYELITDAAVLRDLCKTVVARHPLKRHEYRNSPPGKKARSQLQKFFMGQAMKECKSNAHPERLDEILQQVLSSWSGEEDKQQ